MVMAHRRKLATVAAISMVDDKRNKWHLPVSSLFKTQGRVEVLGNGLAGNDQVDK